MYLVVQAVQNFARFIEHTKFGNEANFKFEFGDLEYIILIPISVAIIFTFYLWINRFWKRRMRSISNIMLADALFVFAITMSAMCITQISFRGFGNLIYSITVWIPGPTGCALAFVAYSYYHYHKGLKMQEKELQISRLQQQLSQSQLDALSSKINPHFLYNALNSIARLAASDGLKTRNMAIALSKLFRYNINKEESNYVSVKEELEMVLTYLEIEKIRFEQRLQYSCNVPADLEEELIPRHLLQPLVENAVKHGGSVDRLEINISLSKKEKKIAICVADNGKPFDQDFSPGYGIKSLYDKLDLLTFGKYEIAFENNPKQVCISIGDHKKFL
jgi:sensor histidine kinase YesM